MSARVPASGTRAALDGELLAWMREPVWRDDEARFDRLARALFAFQFAHCAPYGRFCTARGVTPATVAHWSEIPPVPTGAFKELALRCFPAADTVKVFRTSGTSLERRGELHLDTLALYEASLIASLRTLLFCDVAAGASQVAAGASQVAAGALQVAAGAGRTLIRILAPSAEEAPDSSLSHMFLVLVRALGTQESGFDVRRGTLDVQGLAALLGRAERAGTAVALCGTAFAFVHLLEALERDELRFSCPPGSRIMETGGFKGRSRELPRAELYAWLEQRLGVPERRIVNQYGMTELGSQFYDSVLVDPGGPRRKLGPPWARVRIVDPETGRAVAPGETGMIVIHDLANTGSIAAVQTADLGRVVSAGPGGAPGFEVLGREPSAEARGCSIAADAMLGRAAGSAR